SERELRSAIARLPIAPRLVDRRWLTETFYFAFLVDHENFWQTVFEWCHENRKDLNACREQDPKTGKPRLLGPFDKEKKGTSTEPTPIYLTQPASYRDLNTRLMEYIVRKFRDAWPNLFGIADFDFRRAYAYW